MCVLVRRVLAKYELGCDKKKLLFSLLNPGISVFLDVLAKSQVSGVKEYKRRVARCKAQRNPPAQECHTKCHSHKIQETTSQV